MRGCLPARPADIGIRLYEYEGSALTLECRWGSNRREDSKRRSEPSRAYYTPLHRGVVDELLGYQCPCINKGLAFREWA